MIYKKSTLVSAALSGLMLTLGCAGMDGSTSWNPSRHGAMPWSQCL